MKNMSFDFSPEADFAGIDEAGRGPLAGPVVAAAVVLDSVQPIVGLGDSKTLSEKKRQLLEREIKQKAKAWAIGVAEVDEIDRLNILQATFLAMRRAVEDLAFLPEFAYVDGHLCPELPCICEPVVKGDSLIPAISAASILAKEYRDRLMRAFDDDYPQYGFAQHKGYGTKAHRQALRKYGPTPLHRKSFEPVKSWVELQPN